MTSLKKATVASKTTLRNFIARFITPPLLVGHADETRGTQKSHSPLILGFPLFSKVIEFIVTFFTITRLTCR